MIQVDIKANIYTAHIFVTTLINYAKTSRSIYFTNMLIASPIIFDVLSALFLNILLFYNATAA